MLFQNGSNQQYNNKEKSMKTYNEITSFSASHFVGPLETIYVGSAIDQAKGAVESFQELSDAVVKGARDITVFNPLTAYNNAQKAKTVNQLLFVKNMNEAAISKAQGAAFAWRNQPSFGVPVEIDYFARARKPFFVVNLSGKNLGLYLRSAIEESLGFQCETLDDLTTYVEAYNELAVEGKLCEIPLHQIKSEVNRVVKQKTDGFRTLNKLTDKVQEGDSCGQ